MYKLKLPLFGLIFSLFLTAFAHSAEPAFKPGGGEFVYAGYASLKDKPVTVHYYIPEDGDIRTMPVLFAFSGAGRGAKGNLTTWKPFAQLKKFIVIAPEYAKKHYSNNEYQFGGVSKDDTRYLAVPKERWTYNTVEAIFDFFKKETGNKSETYDIWGHSAGGQFVHRFLLWMPDARVNRAVAANPGVWTFPLMEGLKDGNGEVFAWPYSVKDTLITKDQLRKFFARKMWVVLGDRDIDTKSKSFPKMPGAMAEGGTRFERGKNFFEMSKKTAAGMNAEFNWKISVVKGVAHAGRGIVYGTSTKDENNKSVYSVDNITKTASYWLLYGDR